MTSAISPALATLPRPGLGASSRSRVASSFGDLLGDVPDQTQHSNVDSSRDQARQVDRPHAHEAHRADGRGSRADRPDENAARADADIAEAGEVAAAMWSHKDTPAAEPVDADVPMNGVAVAVEDAVPAEVLGSVEAAGSIEVGAADAGLDEFVPVDAESVGGPIDPEPANPTMALVNRALEEARNAAKGADIADETAATATVEGSSDDGDEDNDVAAGDVTAARSDDQQAASTTTMAVGQVLESGLTDPLVATGQSSAADAASGAGAADAVSNAAGSVVKSTDDLRTALSDQAVPNEAVPNEAVPNEAVANEAAANEPASTEMAGNTAADELVSGDGSTETAPIDAVPVTSEAAMDQAAELAADIAAASRPPQSPAHILRSGFELASSGISRSAAMLVERVLDAVDRAASLPPPRAVTLDLEEQHGIKIRVVSEPGGVSVTVDDAGAGTADANRWQRDLSDMLDKRRQNNSAGFESAATAAGATAGVRAAGPHSSARFMNRSASISSLVAQSTGQGSFDGRL